MDASPLPPLTHQELLAHAGAFVRAGWRVDLPASDRAARRLVLHARPRSDGAARPDGAWPGPCTETLWLDDEGDGDLRLTRQLQPSDGGPPARAEAEGASVVELLQRLDGLPPEAQFEATAPQGGAPGWSLHLRVPPGAAAPVLRRAEARLPGLRLEARVSSVRGYDAELVLERAPAPGAPAPRALPDDLLEVLGRPFGRLVPTATGWRGSIALGGGEPGRSRQARTRLARALGELERTLAEPPGDFHRRHRAARWGVSLRRSLPLGVGLSLVGLALWGALRTEGADAWLGALANGAPPLLLVLLFMRREMLRLELPRWPRPPRPDDWTAPVTVRTVPASTHLPHDPDAR